MPPTDQGIETGDAPPFADGVEHLLAELDRLRLRLRGEVLRVRAAHLCQDDQFRGLYISDEQVDAVLRERGPAAESPGMAEVHRSVRESGGAIAARVRASRSAGIVLPLERLAQLYALTDFERDALVACVASEVDLGFEILCSYAQNDVTRKRPTPDLILRMLCDAPAQRLEHRAAFLAEATLLRVPLVRFAEDAQNRDPVLLAHPLRAEERIVDFLLGRSGIDGRLQGFTTSVPAVPRLPAPLPAALENAARICAHGGGALLFHGSGGVGKRTAAAALAAGRSRPLLTADLARARAANDPPLPTALLLLRREAELLDANLHLTGVAPEPDEPPGQTLAVRTALARLFPLPAATLLTVGGESLRPVEALLPPGVGSLAFEFPVPAQPDRARLWDEALTALGCPRAPDVDLAALAGRFALAAGTIHAACREARDRAALRGTDGAVTRADLEAAARAKSGQGLRELAKKVTTTQEWADLVLPPRPMRQLREVCASEKHRHQVYTDWGFERRLALGKGLNVLFSGGSGTGKTMSAGLLARELALDLYKIDLSSVVSKYIGETEKQLNRIFREAQSSNAILFFDEADALFGKRSEVKDAHDRYANVEVAYLLQKMEEYEGVVILATNFRKNMDEAFTRRMHHIVEFPFPDAEHRARIWKSVLPADAPLADDVDLGFLARQFELSGGNIRNVALAAAFLAAEEGTPIGMKHFVLATARELQKLGKLPSRAEFGEYYDLTRTRG